MEVRYNTILITGGTSGFGLEFATRLIDLGNAVIITVRIFLARKYMKG